MRLKLTIQYDGTEYHGWQVQPGQPTVQGELERAFRELEPDGVALRAAGRTDAGVHALGQVAHACVRNERPPDVWLRALNIRLPLDIRVANVEPAGDGFHARRSATGKVYRYRICTGPYVSPFDYRYVAHAPRPHDVAAMRDAASVLVGRHDFEAFTVSDRETLTTVRDLRRLDVTESGSEISIEAEASGFLRAMVRTLAGTLLAVGDGRLEVSSVAAALEAKRREMAGPTAPARGLTLVRVDY